MKTKTIIIWVITIFALLALLVWAGSKNISSSPEQSGNAVNSGETKGQLTASETLYDFGTISMTNGNVSKVFKVTNSTNADILIPSLTTSCMCTKAYLVQPNGNKKGPFGMPGMGFVPKVNETIKAGESRDIEVVYDPNAHGPAGVGRIDRFVYLTDESGGELQLEIKALVTP